MSFFPEESHRERARIIEERQREVEEGRLRGVEKILATRTGVAKDIIRRAQAAFVRDGPVSSVSGSAEIKGWIRRDFDSVEYLQALREIEEYIAREFSESGSKAVVECSLSEFERATGRWDYTERPVTETVQEVKASVTFEPPLS